MGGKINIGEKVFFNHDCSLTCNGAGITIGDGTIFGEGVRIYDHNHQYKDTTRPIKEQGYTSAPVKIGRHCWIGSNVVVLKGVTIGDNCVVGVGVVICAGVKIADNVAVGANATVSKDLTKAGLYVSQPLRYIEYDAEKKIESLGEPTEDGVYRKK